MNSMFIKNWWKLRADRIDALSLRERAMIFVVALACCMALADILWLSPAQTRQQQIHDSVKKQNGELQVLREQLNASLTAPPGTDAGKAMRLELGRLKSRLESVNREIASVNAATGEAVDLSKVLVHFLRRHEGLTLERTATLAADAKEAQPASGGPASSSVPRQGVELTVSGSYLELMRYVQTLEQALPALRWGRMKLSSGKGTPQLTLQVFLLGNAP